MAMTRDEIMDFIERVSGDPAAAVKMAPYYADLGAGNTDFSADEDYEALLDVLLEADEDNDHAFTAPFRQRYAEALNDSPQKLVRAIEADMRDNYVLAGITLKAIEIAEDAPNLPVAAWAAFNKNRYEGIKGGEFALTRILGWAGFDLSAQDSDNGYTALHYFASMNVPPYSNPRAIAWLLSRGADPSARNDNGDTPLIYLGASVRWTEALTQSFLLLANDERTDLFAQASDGATAMSIMQENDQKAPSEQRQALIAAMEKIAIGAELATPDSRGRPVLAI